jgi:hypothetical protein
MKIPADGLRFLRELKLHNDKTWFDAKRRALKSSCATRCWNC